MIFGVLSPKWDQSLPKFCAFVLKKKKKKESLLLASKEGEWKGNNGQAHLGVTCLSPCIGTVKITDKELKFSSLSPPVII